MFKTEIYSPRIEDDGYGTTGLHAFFADLRTACPANPSARLTYAQAPASTPGFIYTCLLTDRQAAELALKFGSKYALVHTGE